MEWSKWKKERVADQGMEILKVLSAGRYLRKGGTEVYKGAEILYLILSLSIHQHAVGSF